MKRKIISLVIVLLPILAFSQFDYSFDLVASVDRNKITNPIIAINYEDLPRYNFRIGGNFNFKIFDNSFIKTGLRYTELGHKTLISGLRWPSETGPNGYEPDPTLPKYFETTVDTRNIEAPLIGRYEVRTGNFSFFIETGISLLFSINTVQKRTSNVSSETTVLSGTNEDGRIQVALVLSGGLNYNLNQKYQLFLQPVLRTIPTKSTMFVEVKSIRSFGVEFGIRRGFNFAKETSKSTL